MHSNGIEKQVDALRVFGFGLNTAGNSRKTMNRMCENEGKCRH